MRGGYANTERQEGDRYGNHESNNFDSERKTRDFPNQREERPRYYGRPSFDGKLLISFKDAATTVVDSKACAAAEVAVIYPCVDAEEVTFRSEGVNAAGEMEISEAITEVDTTEKAIPTATSIKARDLKSAKIIER